MELPWMRRREVATLAWLRLSGSGMTPYEVAVVWSEMVVKGQMRILPQEGIVSGGFLLHYRPAKHMVHLVVAAAASVPPILGLIQTGPYVSHVDD